MLGDMSRIARNYKHNDISNVLNQIQIENFEGKNDLLKSVQMIEDHMHIHKEYVQNSYFHLQVQA